MARITPAIEARIRVLSATGLSSRKIAGTLALEGVSLTHDPIARLLRDPATPAALEIMGRPGGAVAAPSRRGRLTTEEKAGMAQRRPQGGRGAPDGGEADAEGVRSPADAAAGHRAARALAATPVDPGAPHADVIERIRGRLDEVDELIAKARADNDLQGYRDMLRLEIDLAKKLRELIPEPPLKPEDDPANQAARDQVRARILDATEESEAQRGDLCPRCMLERQSAA